MSKRGLKQKAEGREPNMLCVYGSGIKYKKCCGKGTKGIGKFTRQGIKDTKNKVPKVLSKSDEQTMMDTLRFALFRMGGRRGR